MASPSGRPPQGNEHQQLAVPSGSQDPPSPSRHSKMADDDAHDIYAGYTAGDPARQTHGSYFEAKAAEKGALSSHLEPQPAQQGPSSLAGPSPSCQSRRDRRAGPNPQDVRNWLRQQSGAVRVAPNIHPAPQFHATSSPIAPTALQVGNASASRSFLKHENRVYQQFDEDIDANGSPDDEKNLAVDGYAEEDANKEDYYIKELFDEEEQLPKKQDDGPDNQHDMTPDAYNQEAASCTQTRSYPLQGGPGHFLERPRTEFNSQAQIPPCQGPTAAYSPGRYTPAGPKQQNNRCQVPPPAQALDGTQVRQSDLNLSATPISAPGSARTPTGKVKRRKDKEVEKGSSHTRERHSNTQLFFNNHEEAAKELKGPQWSFPANDSTIPQTDTEKQEWVRRLFEAFQNREGYLDKASGPVVKARWLKTTSDGKYIDYYGEPTIERVCWEIVETVCKLHNEGPGWILVFDQETWKKGEKESSLNFQERMEALIELLRLFKNRCDKMMKGENTFATILAPLEAKKTAENNRDANDHRQECLKEGRILKNRGTRNDKKTGGDEEGLGEDQAPKKRAYRKKKDAAAAPPPPSPPSPPPPPPHQAPSQPQQNPQTAFAARLQQGPPFPDGVAYRDIAPSQRGGLSVQNADLYRSTLVQPLGGYVDSNAAPYNFEQGQGYGGYGRQITPSVFRDSSIAPYGNTHGSSQAGFVYPDSTMFRPAQGFNPFPNSNLVTPLHRGSPIQGHFEALARDGDRYFSEEQLGNLVNGYPEGDVGFDRTGFGGPQAFKDEADQNAANPILSHAINPPTLAVAARGRKRGSDDQAPMDGDDGLVDAHKRHRRGW